MKKFLLSAVALVLLATTCFAQITTCEGTYTPATDGFTTGSLIPYSPNTMPTFTVNEPVDFNITIKCPANVTVSGFSLSVNSLEFLDFTGLPTGLTCCLTQTTLTPDQTAVLHISGTPTTAGDFPLTMKGNVGSDNFMATVVNGIFSSTGVSTGITFTVVDANALHAAMTTNPVPESAGIFTNQAVRISVGESVTFTNASSNAHHIAWSLPGASTETSTENSLTVTYATAGNYTATLTAYNEDESQSHTATMPIVVSEVDNSVTAAIKSNPEASFDLGGITGGLENMMAIQIGAGETVKYITNCSENTHHVAWTFAGGNPAESTVMGDSIAVTYNTIGEFITTLIAFNEDGTESDTASVKVKVASNISAAIVSNPAVSGGIAGLIGGSIQIERGASVKYIENCSNGTHHVAWTFEGGDPATSTVMDDSISVAYATVGTFTTKLIAYNQAEDLTDTATITVTVSAPAEEQITADFTTDPAYTSIPILGNRVSIATGATITYTNASSANTHHVTWTFEGGDPATSTEMTNAIVVTYAAAGTYTTTLVASNEDGTITNTKTLQITVTDPAITASFTTDPMYTDLYVARTLNIEQGTSVVYTNTSTLATSISWDFQGGDPATSEANEVTVTYAEVGNFTTTLTAYGANDTTATATLTVMVAATTSIEEATSEISVYPNPATTSLNVAVAGMQNITIFDMNGRIVMSKEVNSNEETIDVANFAKANYVVRITTNDSIIIRNVVVE